MSDDVRPATDVEAEIRRFVADGNNDASPWLKFLLARLDAERQRQGQELLELREAVEKDHADYSAECSRLRARVAELQNHLRQTLRNIDTLDPEDADWFNAAREVAYRPIADAESGAALRPVEVSYCRACYNEFPVAYLYEERCAKCAMEGWRSAEEMARRALEAKEGTP